MADFKYQAKYVDKHDALVEFITTDEAEPMRKSVPMGEYDYVNAIYDFLDGLKKGELYNMSDNTICCAYMGYFIVNHEKYLTD